MTPAMGRRELVATLALLAALWGASFIFMRMGAADFGPVALSALRVGGAAACLLPLAMWRGEIAALRRHAGPIFIVGLTNSALPFVASAWSTLALGGALAAIFNATSPLWGALIAWAWLGERPGGWRTAGLALGFGGVVALAAAKSGLAPSVAGYSVPAAIAAGLAAAACYGYAVNFTRKRLQGVPPMAVAAGSQLSAALLLAVPAAWLWPSEPPDARAWLATAALAVLCTALAYILYFRLIARAGAVRAIAVTFLVPLFAMVWGALWLGERIDAAMLVGCAVILAGTALATGLWPRRTTA
jgi:drug/metabolite transporter (DMT)-like permease